MSLNDLEREFRPDIERIANDLTASLPFDKAALRAAYSDQELSELDRMLKDVQAAIDDNEKTARLARHAGTALGLLKRLGVLV